MAFRKENKVKSDFDKIVISLASPEMILAPSRGEALCVAREFSVRLRITNATAENTSVFAIRESFVTVAELK